MTVRTWMSRHKQLTGAAIGTTVAAITVIALVIAHGQAPRTYPPARTRATIDFTACLLTPPTGIESATSSAAAWQGILQAQATTNLRAQTLAVLGPDTPTNAETAVNTLALRGCNLIIAATPVETAAIDQQAHDFPNQHFAVATAGTTTTPASNITTITATNPHAISAQITQLTETDIKTCACRN